MKLVSLDEFLVRMEAVEEIDLNRDKILDQLVHQYSARFENYIGRELLKKEREAEFPSYYGALIVSAFPVDTDEDLTVLRRFYSSSEDDDELGADDYTLSEKSGIIRLAKVYSAASPFFYVVTYTGGFPRVIESAPAQWSADVSYAKGTRVTHNDSYYRAKVEHESEAGNAPPDSDTWDPYTLDEWLDFSTDAEVGETLKGAMLDQVSTHYRRRKSLDALTVSVGGAAETVGGAFKLLPEVMESLNALKQGV